MQVQSAQHSSAEYLAKVLREFTMQKFPDVVVHGLAGGTVWVLTMGADGKFVIEKLQPDPRLNEIFQILNLAIGLGADVSRQITSTLQPLVEKQLSIALEGVH